MFEETIKASIELWRDRGNLQIGLAAEFREQGNFISMLTACNWARECFDHMDALRRLKELIERVKVDPFNFKQQKELLETHLGLYEIPDSSQLHHVVAQH